VSHHAPITTLAEYDAINDAECVEGYLGAERGDPEPGANHTRSYHHGWRTRMMDLHEIPMTEAHNKLVRAVMDRRRIARGEPPKWPAYLKVTT
jgi:hypothetical protein